MATKERVVKWNKEQSKYLINKLNENKIKTEAIYSNDKQGVLHFGYLLFLCKYFVSIHLDWWKFRFELYHQKRSNKRYGRIRLMFVTEEGLQNGFFDKTIFMLEGGSKTY